MATSSGVSGSELRHRLPRNPEKPQQAESIDVARDAVVELNSAEEGSDKDEKEKRTFGRTPDGTGKFGAAVCQSKLMRLLNTLEMQKWAAFPIQDGILLENGVMLTAYDQYSLFLRPTTWCLNSSFPTSPRTSPTCSLF